MVIANASADSMSCMVPPMCLSPRRAVVHAQRRYPNVNTALPSPSCPAHIRPMAKPPDSKKPKDPARPTRAKAAREPLPPIAPALEQLLNPGIAKGTAGVGSQTGLNPDPKAAKRSGTLPGGNDWKEQAPKTGLQPPADNSW